MNHFYIYFTDIARHTRIFGVSLLTNEGRADIIRLIIIDKKSVFPHIKLCSVTLHSPSPPATHAPTRAPSGAVSACRNCARSHRAAHHHLRHTYPHVHRWRGFRVSELCPVTLCPKTARTNIDQAGPRRYGALTLPVGGAGAPAAGMFLALCGKVDFFAHRIHNKIAHKNSRSTAKCGVRLVQKHDAKKSTFWNKMEDKGFRQTREVCRLP
jgi:hypothetical protein